MISEVSRRYAGALYEIARSKNTADKVFGELRVLGDVVNADRDIREFLLSPLVSPENKIKALSGALNGKISEELMNTIRLMAEKNRLATFEDLVSAFESISDEAHGVTRGTVKSAAALSPEEKKRIEETVNKVTKKKVILKFEEDPSLLGGMVAQVGGWTFDDSLQSHLTKLTDVLNRN